MWKLKILGYITVHHLVFLCVSASPTGVSVVGTSAAGISTIGGDALEGVNSPCAMSKEVLPSSRTLGAEENHPPGKNREDAVDSSLARGFGDGVPKDVEVVSAPAFSSTGAKRETEGLKRS